MPWMEVEVHEKAGGGKIAVNLDHLVKFGKWIHGSYLVLTSGDSINVIDSYEEIVQVVLKAQSK